MGGPVGSEERVTLAEHEGGGVRDAEGSTTSVSVHVPERQAPTAMSPWTQGESSASRTSTHPVMTLASGCPGSQVSWRQGSLYTGQWLSEGTSSHPLPGVAAKK